MNGKEVDEVVVARKAEKNDGVEVYNRLILKSGKTEITIDPRAKPDTAAYLTCGGLSGFLMPKEVKGLISCLKRAAEAGTLSTGAWGEEVRREDQPGA